MPQLGTMSLEIEGLLLLLLLAPTIHATATHLANKSCRRERGKKKSGNQRMGAKVEGVYAPDDRVLHLQGNIFHTLQQLGVLSFRVSPPLKKKENQFLNWFPTLPCLPRLGISF